MTVEPLVRTSPLQAWAGRFAALPAGVELREEPFVAMIDLRTTPHGPATARVAAVIGAALPGGSTAARGGSATAIWLGPDEWLVTDPSAAPTALEAELRAAVGPDGGAVVDVSAHRTTVVLNGRHARDVLATGCAIDLHPRAFSAGSAVQTTIGGVGVILLAEDTGYRLLVRASCAAHLVAWLADAAQEFRA